MSRKFIILILTFLPIFMLSQQRWEIIIGNNNFDYSSIRFENSYDKGYLLSAKTAWNNTLMMKTDINGKLLWEKAFVKNSLTTIHRIKQNAEGETLFLGITENDAILFLVDACGELLWCNEFISEHYTQSLYADAVFLDNGDIIVLTVLANIDNEFDVGLMSFDSNGNMLWFQPFNLLDKYDLLGDLMIPFYFDSFNDCLIISGFCYYAYPDNPSGKWLRPMFIKTDSLYNEEWLLPYGMDDSISGDARGVISFGGSSIQGYGLYDKTGTDTINSILMNFDNDGNETSYIGIDNSEIGPDIADNFFFRLVRRDDTSYMASAKFGPGIWDNPMGEWVMDSLGNVYQYQNHANTNGSNIAPILKTKDKKFLFAHQYNNSDILLYKLNADLSQADIYTNTYAYDSLCDHPIVSDTIYLDNCGIVTDIEETPTPQEYYSYIKTIPVHIFPNPAKSGITFELENTENHINIRISCFDINGKLVFEQMLPPGQTQIKTTVSGWQKGMYIAVASSSTGGAGSAKFVVK